MTNDLRQSKGAASVFLVIRLYLGYTFLSAGLGKLMSGNFDASGFVQGALARSDAGVIQSWWGSFLEGIVLPNAEVFSFLVMWGETLVGLTLLLGAFTGFAAFMGILMNISFLLSGAIQQNLVLIILGLVLLIGGANAGRYGVDRWIMPSLRNKGDNRPARNSKRQLI
ncbi:DoxX family membrane protein [Terribacillus sp. JSM ZJ617]|uniref:DoxX family membrane protein n=1 Tax=Terribacillus sp. JSM ZJ617 TaxID=3342119 RepID=UPI0035A892E7